MQTPVAADVPAGASLEATSVVGGLVLDAARALFDTYGVKLDLDGTPVERTLTSVELISTIGFSSPTLNGSLLLAIPNVVLDRTLPTPGASLADWSGELANQLLGRLKNQLLNYEVVLSLALPVVISGATFVLPARRDMTRYFSFVCEWGRLFVRSEMRLSSSIELIRQTQSGENAGIDEGELLLF